MPFITAYKIPGPYLKEDYCRPQLRYLHDCHNDMTENQKLPISIHNFSY